MDKQFSKDLFLVSFINLAMCLNHLGTILFPFYLSMIHKENDSISS